MTPFLVVSCCARNEADILDAFIAFHLSQGVDLVLVTDHASEDATRELLEHYGSTGRVLFSTVHDSMVRQGEWMTEMAEKAAALGATWVINSDADEFWMTRIGSLRELFLALPDGVDLVHAFHQDFLPAVAADGFSAGHQTVWDTGLRSGFYGAKPKPKVAHRAGRGIRVADGNHRVTGLERDTALGWLPIDILHFPVRSYAQLEQKVASQFSAWSRTSRPSAHIRLLHRRHESGELRAYYDSVVDPAAIESGLACGRLAEDTRLAEALARLRRVAADDHAPGVFRSPSGYELPGVAPSAASPQVARAVSLGRKAVSLHDKAVRTGAMVAPRGERRFGERFHPGRLRRAPWRLRRPLSRVLGWARPQRRGSV
jgi:hypothetical protein